MNLEENVASALCYVLFWVTGIIFYIMETNNKIVRFHAMQSILLFLPLHIFAVVFGFWFLWWLGGIIMIFVFILWVVLMLKAYQGEKFKLPIVGDIAEKQAQK